MIDRRSTLKKLAGGGVIIAASPAIVSATAFAYGAPSGNVGFLAQGSVLALTASFTVTFRARYRCVSNAGTKTVCKSWEYGFSRTLLSSWTFGAPVIGTACPD